MTQPTAPPSRRSSEPSGPETFVPPVWLRNRHLQTVLANKPLRLPSGPPVEDLRLDLPDGDVVRLVRSKPQHGMQHHPVAIVLHGLAGGYDSAYARDVFSALAGIGVEAHMLHFRGCGGVPNRLPRGYHAGDTADLAYYAARLREQHPSRPIVAVGYSLGANVLLKYLGEHGDASAVDLAVAVSVPFLLDDACESISRGFSKVYQNVLLTRLKQAMAEKFTAYDAPFDLDAMHSAPGLKAFDDLVTAPMHGFRNVDHYYTASSCRQFLPGITVPALIVHAVDDPFQSSAGIPTPGEVSDTTTLALQPFGGHVGFLAWHRREMNSAWEGASERRAGLRSWLAPKIAAWVSNQLGSTGTGGAGRGMR
jgi:predicted alpha/beta-fold hydrolase